MYRVVAGEGVWEAVGPVVARGAADLIGVVLQTVPASVADEFQIDALSVTAVESRGGTGARPTFTQKSKPTQNSKSPLSSVTHILSHA